MKANYIFNKLSNVNPVERKNIYLQLNYDNEAIIAQQLPQVGIKNLRFAREDVAKFYEYIKTTNEGIFYAPTFDIQLCRGTNNYTVPMYFDLTDGLNTSKDGIEVAIKLYRSLDWLNDRMDGFTFESVMLNPLTAQDIAAKNYIQAKTIFVPYIISTRPDNLHSFMAIMTIITMYISIKQQWDIIVSYFTPAAANPFTSVPTFIGLAVHIAFASTIILALIATIEMFIFSVIQPVKYHAVIMLSDLIQATCIELGLNFQSSIFQSAPFNQIALLAEKNAPIGDASFSDFFVGLFKVKMQISGYTNPDISKQNGYPLMTGGDILRLAKKLVNGKILIQEINGQPTLILERRDYNPNTPKYEMPDVRKDWNGYNTKEFFATTILRFQKDLNDKNLSYNYTGTILSSIVSPITAPDPLLVLTKNVREIEIDASRGIRKEDLTLPELLIFGNKTSDYIGFYGVFIVFYDVVIVIIDVLVVIANIAIAILSALLDVLNFILPDDDQIPVPDYIPLLGLKSIQSNYGQDRIGMLLLENDIVSTSKLIMLDVANKYIINGQTVMKLDKMNSCIVNALNIWNQFYCIDSWVPIDPSKFPTYSDPNGSNTPPAKLSDKGKHNQFTLWSPSLNKSSDKNKIPLSFDDFELLKTNNNFTEPDGSKVIADSIDWHFEEGWMDLQYRKNEIYSQNLQNSITLPDGN